ncbi:MAG TPA: response regulator [Puia sp.]|nr:response regulator [Puia sp.]
MKKILFIDDDPEFRDNMAEILRLSHYDVDLAGNAKEGVEKAIRGHPDLILCDIILPTADGYAILHSLQHDPATAGIPFIFITGRTEKDDWRRAMAMGADDYLMKPIEGVEMLRAVESCLRKKEKREKGVPVEASAEEPIESDDDSFLAELAQRTNQTYRKKQVLYLEGQRPACIYYILSGKVKIYRSDADGKELIMGLYQAGDFFGYPAVLDGRNFSDNAQALEDVRLVQIPRQEFLWWMESKPAIARRFIRLISKEATVKDAGLLNLAYNSLRKRVANGLIRLESLGHPDEQAEGAVAISRENLANIVGCATESLTRTLSDFKSEKLIDIRSGKIYILNGEKLKNLVN